MEKSIYEIFVPVGGVLEELQIVRWAYENSKPLSWSKWDTGYGVLVTFDDAVQAHLFKKHHNGFSLGDIEDLKCFYLKELSFDMVLSWCEDNVQGDWRLVENKQGVRLVLGNDDDALLFRLSFD